MMAQIANGPDYIGKHAEFGLFTDSPSPETWLYQSMDLAHEASCAGKSHDAVHIYEACLDPTQTIWEAAHPCSIDFKRAYANELIRSSKFSEAKLVLDAIQQVLEPLYDSANDSQRKDLRDTLSKVGTARFAIVKGFYKQADFLAATGAAAENLHACQNFLGSDHELILRARSDHVKCRKKWQATRLKREEASRTKAASKELVQLVSSEDKRIGNHAAAGDEVGVSLPMTDIKKSLDRKRTNDSVVEGKQSAPLVPAKISPVKLNIHQKTEQPKFQQDQIHMSMSEDVIAESEVVRISRNQIQALKSIREVILEPEHVELSQVLPDHQFIEHQEARDQKTNGVVEVTADLTQPKSLAVAQKQDSEMKKMQEHVVTSVSPRPTRESEKDRSPKCISGVKAESRKVKKEKCALADSANTPEMKRKEPMLVPNVYKSLLGVHQRDNAKQGSQPEVQEDSNVTQNNPPQILESLEKPDWQIQTTKTGWEAQKTVQCTQFDVGTRKESLETMVICTENPGPRNRSIPGQREELSTNTGCTSTSLYTTLPQKRNAESNAAVVDLHEIGDRDMSSNGPPRISDSDTVDETVTCIGQSKSINDDASSDTKPLSGVSGVSTTPPEVFTARSHGTLSLEPSSIQSRSSALPESPSESTTQITEAQQGQPVKSRSRSVSCEPGHEEAIQSDLQAQVFELESGMPLAPATAPELLKPPGSWPFPDASPHGPQSRTQDSCSNLSMFGWMGSPFEKFSSWIRSDYAPKSTSGELEAVARVASSKIASGQAHGAKPTVQERDDPPPLPLEPSGMTDSIQSQAQTIPALDLQGLIQPSTTPEHRLRSSRSAYFQNQHYQHFLPVPSQHSIFPHYAPPNHMQDLWYDPMYLAGYAPLGAPLHHPRNRTYGSTNVSGNAITVQGDVTRLELHYHFNSDGQLSSMRAQNPDTG